LIEYTFLVLMPAGVKGDRKIVNNSKAGGGGNWKE
jgi:hypothetical protein